MRLPKTIGGLADLAYKLQQERLAAERAIEELKAREKIIAETALGLLNKQKAESARGKVGVVTKVSSVEPNVKDWKKFYAYIKRTNSFDLLQRRVGKGAWRDRLDQKKRVPGIESVSITRLRVTKVGKKKS